MWGVASAIQASRCAIRPGPARGHALRLLGLEAQNTSVQYVAGPERAVVIRRPLLQGERPQPGLLGENCGRIRGSRETRPRSVVMPVRVTVSREVCPRRDQLVRQNLLGLAQVRRMIDSEQAAVPVLE